ncbi:hypothetical protein AUK41_02450 [Candidatus Berkelbacteria bacterium CG2_30_43_20]|uniref:Uncharacterized protein n=1 Tax=Candidatus Berkelbacteria bacterium CG10_big_fil_rev_8_21_14_0_10_43_14 TaxID=1974515 RepID=A0A2M6R8B7_9BACT|nr:MAG: hypothetical protein AUK41_02450 [Candidatus Berkelbacteria bacterium CG2_30_43_20]PIS06884.1 MAG: hypothetical protein COT79_02175 [Candidatus Berkelbacteria bacterium CG10_big_fil_rev_8_21_14_0_10_43_14]
MEVNVVKEVKKSSVRFFAGLVIGAFCLALVIGILQYAEDYFLNHGFRSVLRSSFLIAAIWLAVSLRLRSRRRRVP